MVDINVLCMVPVFLAFGQRALRKYILVYIRITSISMYCTLPFFTNHFVKSQRGMAHHITYIIHQFVSITQKLDKLKNVIIVDIV